MSAENSRVEADRQLIREASERGTGSKLLAFTKLSGPGWLQGAITLGGGSLAGSLYLGVIGGYSLLWLQPIMMVLGIIMLSAIAYVALSTGERPFGLINRHVNPVLGWGWAIATLLANMVWAMPQFSLGTAALEQNLLPGVFGGENGSYLAVALLFIVSSVIIWFYDSGGWGIRLFEIVLKVMVAVVVLSFFGVVIAMTFREPGLPWGEIVSSFVPDFGLLFEPAEKLKGVLAGIPDSQFWQDKILESQRVRMVTAAATAVGINMTFLLPYSMLKRGWDKDFRGLAVFDLSTGLFIPFLLATSCVVIASSSQFHGQYDLALTGEAPMTESVGKLANAYNKSIDARIVDNMKRNEPELYASLSRSVDGMELEAEIGDRRASLPLEEKRLAAMLIERDAFQLAGSLEKLAGKNVSQYVFGIGVLGMALSTIIILMLINGFTVCEMLGQPSRGVLHRIGSLIPGITGALGFLYIWGDAERRFWLAVPTSVFGMALLPIAYITFFFLLNSRKVLGESLPKGGKRVVVNLLMILAIAGASIGAGWAIWRKGGPIAVGLIAGFFLLALLVHILRKGRGGETNDGTA